MAHPSCRTLTMPKGFNGRCKSLPDLAAAAASPPAGTRVSLHRSRSSPSLSSLSSFKTSTTRVARPGPVPAKDLSSPAPSPDARLFTGFTEAQMAPVREMRVQLKRNQALSLLETASVLACLVGTSQHENAFEITERALCIGCCVSNAYCLGIATEHFRMVKQDDQDGLTFVLAGVQDLNALFSNITFVVILRGLVQCMEAGIANPNLMAWLQGWGACAALGRLFLIQQFVDGSRLKRRQEQPDGAHEPEPLLSRVTRYFTSLFNNPEEEDQLQAGRGGAAEALEQESALPLLLAAPNGSLLAARDDERFAGIDGDPAELEANAADALVLAEALDLAKCPISVAHTSVTMEELSSFGTDSQGLQQQILGSCGISVDNTPAGEAQQPGERAEYEVSGSELKVLVACMDQLNWSSVAMLLLSLSSTLLCIGKGLPQEAVSLGIHSLDVDNLTRVIEEVPDLVSAGVEISEQVVMAVALSNAKHCFSSVITEKKGRDVTQVLNGLCEHKGVGRFLETWSVVQCGVIAFMLSQLTLSAPWMEIPARESIKLLGELIK